VHVVTTSEGAHRIHLQLLDEKMENFMRYAAITNCVASPSPPRTYKY
jgi:hypothetical protein